MCDLKNDLEFKVGKLLKEKKFTVSCAESCTGGLLTSKLTDVPGSSDYLKGAIVAYSNEIKISTLNVKEATLKKFGAVSEETAQEMADNVRKILNTDIGVGVTGIAGPTGATENKPIGLVYISVSGMHGSQVQKFNFSGSRIEIKSKVVNAALTMVQNYLDLR